MNKGRLYELTARKLVFTAMAADGVDCTDELAEIEKGVAKEKKRAEVAEIAEYYAEKKRWKGSLTDSQKKKIKEYLGVSPQCIAETVLK